MQIRKLTRKAAALVMAAVTALSIILATTAFAATGDVGTISFNMTYDSNGNAHEVQFQCGYRWLYRRR